MKPNLKTAKRVKRAIAIVNLIAKVSYLFQKFTEFFAYIV